MSIRNNALYNLSGAALPLLLSLVTIPLYINLVGDARYGVLSIAWLLLGYFGLFDLGLGRATAQRIAALGSENKKDCAEIFWTALAMNAGFGIVGGLLIWPVANYFFAHVFSVEQGIRTELKSAIPWLILAVPLATLSGVLSGTLQGRGKFLEINIISASSSIFLQLVPLCVASLHGPDLAWLLPVTILTRIFALLILYWRCEVHVAKGQPRQISRSHIKDLLSYGGWVTVTSLISPIMVILDRFVIAAAMSAKDVTYYTVPYQLAERTAVIPGAVTSALFPRLVASSTTEERHLVTTTVQSLSVVMTPLIVFGILLIEPFLKWWLSPEFGTRAALTAQILQIAFWINGFAQIPYAHLQAKGRPDLVAKCHLIEAAPYVVLLYVALHNWGLPGAATVFAIRAFADCVLLFLFARTLTIAINQLRFPLLLLTAAIAVATIFTPGTTYWWLSAIGLEILVLRWAWYRGPENFRAFIKQFNRNWVNCRTNNKIKR